MTPPSHAAYLALTKHQSPLSMMCGTLLRCKHANSPSPLDVTNAAFRRSLGFFVGVDLKRDRAALVIFELRHCL
jgi:hypothetical protein